MVAQEPVLYARSVYDNVLMGLHSHEGEEGVMQRSSGANELKMGNKKNDYRSCPSLSFYLSCP
jgi:hypothetical protein